MCQSVGGTPLPDLRMGGLVFRGDDSFVRRQSNHGKTAGVAIRSMFANGPFVRHPTIDHLTCHPNTSRRSLVSYSGSILQLFLSVPVSCLLFPILY